MENLERDLEEMRDYFKSGKTKEKTWRISQLKGLRQFLNHKEEEIYSVLNQDLGKHHVEAFRDEIGTLAKSLNFALEHLDNWMLPKKAKLPAIALLSSAEVVPQPLGVVLIISSWNFPFGLSLEPLIGAVAAGNCVVVKTSECAPASSAFLAKGIGSYVDGRGVRVVEGGAAVGERLLQQPWDKIFFTGSARIGRIVMTAAVKHLTPVTLELGGKCPAIVDSLSSSWDIQAAAKRLVIGKFGACAGQACVAIDYILVEHKFISTLVEMIKKLIKEMFGKSPNQAKSMARIVNKQNFLRLKNLLDEPGVRASIIYGGSMDEDKLFVEPAILLNPPNDAEIMRDEIFGPFLPIIGLDKIEDSIDFVNLRPKPLAIYAFTKDKAFQRRLVSETSSGSLTFNDAVVQYAADTLPFGGVGESGIGRYHGKFSFDTFSHDKAILKRSFLLDFWFRYPPWNNHKLQLLRQAYNLNYFQFVLTVLGLKKS
ncbi:aldehyde dehydrogenase family 3 member F1-like [Momordica charantia]|uniref:Aldehyde dehydrogenase n=1 Tax=Momordica charantia TaxID=3673 RepID=A0A6J1D591_MOMCH|nr:aldehyde dehydrogenase family 3 member F1-like [Momordica charantia]